MKKPIILLSLAINVVTIVGAGYALHKKGGVNWIEAKLHKPVTVQDNRLSVFEALPIHPGDVVMAGDSILALGEWSELMRNPDFKNRAVSGSTIKDTLARLPDILKGRPKLVIFSVGINDIQSQIPLQQSADELVKMVALLKQAYPDTIPVFLEIMPVNHDLYHRVITRALPEVHEPLPSEVAEMNALIERSGVPVRSTKALLKDGQIATDFTNDGLHLNGRGLVELAKIIK